MLDEDTLSALSAWGHSRLGDPEAYHFERIDITENLLDALGVLE